jgi:NAD(P)-dependent dehydrogenase (short-subunit alcohol dehydrogenase family)
MAALVTGAARRLGRAMALHLAREGHNVAVHYAGSKAKADETVAEIQAMGRKALAVRADLTCEADMQALIPKICAALGPLTVLVNNASVFEYDTLAGANRESWDRHFESNLRAPFVLTQHFAAQVPKAQTDENGEPRAQAVVVNMIDQRVRKLTPEFSTYTLAKAALWTLTQTAAQALAPDIRVNAIGPGPTLRAARQSQGHFTAQRQATILQRGANEADIVAALNYILCAPAVTGQLICVDGGQHLGWKTPDILGVDLE